MLGDETSLKFESTEITQTMFSKQSGIKLEIDTDRNWGDSQIYM